MSDVFCFIFLFGFYFFGLNEKKREVICVYMARILLFEFLFLDLGVFVFLFKTSKGRLMTALKKIPFHFLQLIKQSLDFVLLHLFSTKTSINSVALPWLLSLVVVVVVIVKYFRIRQIQIRQHTYFWFPIPSSLKWHKFNQIKSNMSLI